jgi:methyl-accepting chemotaxis protein
MNKGINCIHPEGTATMLSEWLDPLASGLNTLRIIVGSTEEEFLRIGSRLQDFYQSSSTITVMANSLVNIVSGDQAQQLADQLRRLLNDAEAYLAAARSRGRDSSEVLKWMNGLLEQLSEPLEGFQKMTKTLRMLGISTKIESSRMGEKGTAFLLLAQDVQGLASRISEKTTDILGHGQLLVGMVHGSLNNIKNMGTARDRELSAALAGVTQGLEELLSVNSRCTCFGEFVSSLSLEVTESISKIVTSMQMHDMTRQQVEHIVEALERLMLDLRGTGAAPPEEARRTLIRETGDVCELQSAQLRHASSELCSAVRSIMESLRNIAGKQAVLVAKTLDMTGIADSGDSSFMNAIQSGMDAVTQVLVQCAESDREMSTTLSRITDTMREVSGFVSVIEEIGSEIDLISLNAQIKAAHNGQEGAALCVLAEAIKHLSVRATICTESVSRTLVQINQSTEHLFRETITETEQLSARIDTMDRDLRSILDALGASSDELMSLLSGMTSRVGDLNNEIENTIAGIDVHDRVKAMADEVLSCLVTIDVAARNIEPASPAFKDNMLYMEERYTMQSERNIHESIARKRNGTPDAPSAMTGEPAIRTDDSELGDNVDLF